MSRLAYPAYLSFPFRVGPNEPVLATREQHVVELIEHVLFTDPKERIFRPDFGVGVRSLVFESNASRLWKMANRRLVSHLADALLGEVDPKTLEVDVEGEGETLTLTISYRLATIDRKEQHRIPLEVSHG